MISGKSGLSYKLGHYAVICGGNRDAGKMKYQKHLALLVLGGCLATVAGDAPKKRPVLPDVETAPRKVNLNLSKETAIKIAETILISIYGKEVLRQRPWQVTESETEFQISGTLAPSSVGGVAEISIRKSDAGVVRYTHGK